ncbi:hypothetical protein H072_8472 [Dactylellina haptotyla CBS 200.50]|uniref:Uncharacterized protein n=1 Tax=Dactylellina haptotyla (strain CBS 200.50) TaxID=1284197 RepID=S8A581_DACHA|nr:hypothetical protein H072_8472 [Dactylellina haptotyla CBS 200.50]
MALKTSVDDKRGPLYHETTVILDYSWEAPKREFRYSGSRSPDREHELGEHTSPGIAPKAKDDSLEGLCGLLEQT